MTTAGCCIEGSSSGSRVPIQTLSCCPVSCHTILIRMPCVSVPIVDFSINTSAMTDCKHSIPELLDRTPEQCADNTIDQQSCPDSPLVAAVTQTLQPPVV